MAGGDAPADENKVQQELQTLEQELPAEEASSESGKLKQLMTVLKKTVGVKDLANLRLSLPASLIYPEGNLEYWHYLDRPDLFATIDAHDQELQRMLAVLRWAFSVNLRHVKGKVVKPYNSVLGEQFRAIWDVEPPELPKEGDNLNFKPTFVHSLDTNAPASTSGTPTGGRSQPGTAPSSSASSFKSAAASSQSSLVSNGGAGNTNTGKPLGMTAASSSADSTAAAVGSDSASTTTEQAGSDALPLPKSDDCARVVFLNEQVSHHPPVSSFWYESAPPKGGHRVQAYGVDQLAAKFTGTSVRLNAGEQNYGIYVRLPDRNNEEWRITHPVGNITGLLRGNLYTTISDTSYVTSLSPEGKREKGQTALRAIINYPDESWIKGAKFVLEGVVYKYEIGSDSENWTKIKQVPDSAIVGTIDGSWRGKINWKPKGSKQSAVLIDLSELLPVPKMVRPLPMQHRFESRKLWKPVTEAIVGGNYNAATRHKQVIEQAQRDVAAERAKNNQEHPVELFNDDERKESGRPVLSEKGRMILDEELKGVGYPPSADASAEKLEQLSLSDS